MKVYLKPVPSTLSRAMHRVARALSDSAPSGIEEVDRPEDADLQVMHLIGADGMTNLRARSYAVIQYCNSATHQDGYNVPAEAGQWEEVWRHSSLVWSYYNLQVPPAVNYYHAPLGVDGELFHMPPPYAMGRELVFTSGYVSGPGAEAIEEVALAAAYCGLTVKHLGPNQVQGMVSYPLAWSSCLGITDQELSLVYQRSLWVSGLRHIEGFELPVVEGLACGARPIVFDRPDMREWYDGVASFVPESEGTELIEHLISLFQRLPKTVTEDERKYVLSRFDWRTVASGFWERLGVAA